MDRENTALIATRLTGLAPERGGEGCAGLVNNKAFCYLRKG